MTRLPLFRVRFSDSEHFADIFLHRSVAALRRLRNYKSQTNVSDAEAFAWLVYVWRKNGTIAELHFARDMLSYEHIFHECTHACHHRLTRWLGIAAKDPQFDEEMASSAGQLGGRVIAQFLKMKIPILRIAPVS